jgi:uncharacterized protein (DUF2249 family)
MAADSTRTESETPTRTVDARAIDGEPFSDIMDALDGLPEDGTVLLINSFEPKPLYPVLERKGFDHDITQVADDEWQVEITRT